MTCTQCNQQPIKKPCDNTCEDVEVVDVSELPINLAGKVPDYFYTVNTVVNKNGTVRHSAELTPGASVFPAGNRVNICPLESNNQALEVPTNGVLPAFIENTGVMSVVLPADATHPAQFVVTEIQGEKAYCQNCGWVAIPAGHKYIIGANYYRGTEPGEVTTDPASGQYLFTPVNRYILALDIKRG